MCCLSTTSPHTLLRTSCSHGQPVVHTVIHLFQAHKVGSEQLELLAIGCVDGLWLGELGSLRRVENLKMVTQCAYMADIRTFVVVADKALYACDIDELVPHREYVPPWKKLNGAKDVNFFRVGKLEGQDVVIYKKMKGLDSIFRVLKAVDSAAGNEQFQVIKSFFVPCQTFDVVFLRSKIAILTPKGFEIMQIATGFSSVSIPVPDDPRMTGLPKRCKPYRPIGMFRCSDNDFFLCYDKFGLHVDSEGNPTHPLFQWEGQSAERAVLELPYILLFHNRCIEVRHVDTGKLVQIIPGTNMRCTWDGRGSNVSPGIHGVATKFKDGGAMQHVFEVVLAPAL
ncbi:hypothetical protein PLICRDRAFT_44527 [Plicaturopsis crispa FD-325 SS-3]|nr:hypothetical protein PLICRDRAFT_44527 [Plicaturopsis crispa FD-325 SS-3]